MNALTNADGFDCTEGVQVLLDALYHSMDAGSGFLDYREWCAIRQVAYALGLNPDDFSEGPEYQITGFLKRDVQKTLPWPHPADPLTDEPDRAEEL